MIKEIKGFDGYYISDTGDAYCDLGKGNRDRNKRVDMYKLNPRITKNGYERIYARETSTNKRKDIYIHRAVAEAFIPNPENKKYVNHINCKRNDNDVNNLEWVTAKENNDHTFNMNHIIRDEYGKFESNFNYFNPVVPLVTFSQSLVVFVA